MFWRHTQETKGKKNSRTKQKLPKDKQKKLKSKKGKTLKKENHVIKLANKTCTRKAHKETLWKDTRTCYSTTQIIHTQGRQ